MKYFLLTLDVDDGVLLAWCQYLVLLIEVEELVVLFNRGFVPFEGVFGLTLDKEPHVALVVNLHGVQIASKQEIWPIPMPVDIAI